LNYLKDKLVETSVQYYHTQDIEEKEKLKKTITKIVKKAHRFRETNKEDYEFIKQLTKNIT
jgi:predicted RecB family endonuclease|tara:strand:- start:1039 stop:1221 length:183 start_codon:yes stop_codon:yes gene_type:complete